MEKLLNTPYILPTYQGSRHSTEAKPPVVPAASRFQTETTVLVNKSLAAEIAEWKQKYENLLQESTKLTQQVKQLEEKYKPHNVRRREKRKEKKIRCQADKIDKLEKQLKYKRVAFIKNKRDQLQYYKKKCKRLDKEVGLSECDNCEQLTNENCKMKKLTLS